MNSVTSWKCPYYPAAILPVFTVCTFERLLRIMNSQVSSQVSSACELLRADIALKENLSRHMHHLHMHLQHVLILCHTSHILIKLTSAHKERYEADLVQLSADFTLASFTRVTMHMTLHQVNMIGHKVTLAADVPRMEILQTEPPE